jgi:hypothetical protein
MELSESANLMEFWPPVVTGCYLRRFLIAFTRQTERSALPQQSPVSFAVAVGIASKFDE